jgi:hypothetical protein
LPVIFRRGGARGAPRNGIDRGNHVANGASRVARAASLRALDGARPAAPAGGAAARHVRLADRGRGLWRADGAARPADRGERAPQVLARTEGSEAAEGEALETVLAHLPEGFTREGPRITRPDGVVVDLFGDTPLAVAGRLVQEDLCLLERPEGRLRTPALRRDPVLSGQLDPSEKIGRPLGAIHGPVPDYDPDMAARVQRMFDAIRPGQPALAAERAALCQPDLHQPRTEAAPRDGRGISTRPTCGPNGNACCACRVRARSCSRSTPTCCP